MPVLLFPNSYVPKILLGNIINFLGKPTIFQPWYRSLPEYVHDFSIEVRNPPEHLKPKESFKNILAEYNRWARNNRDKSFQEIARLVKSKDLTDNTTWEIRQMMGKTIQAASSSKEEDVIRWHLLLHLVEEIFEQYLSAESILKGIKNRQALLEGSVEKTDEHGLFDDFPRFEQQYLLSDYQLNQIFEAWFGLFGGYLNENEILITYNKQLLNWFSEAMDNLCPGEKRIDNTLSGMKVPDLGHHSLEDRNRIDLEFGVSGRLRELRCLIFDLDSDPENKLSEIKRLSLEMEKAFPWGLSGRTVYMTIKYLPPVPGDDHSGDKNMLKYLPHKSIILVEQAE